MLQAAKQKAASTKRLLDHGEGTLTWMTTPRIDLLSSNRRMHVECRNAKCPVDGQEKQTRTADAVGSPELLFWSFVFLLLQCLSALVSPWQFRSYSTYLTDTHCPPINDSSAKCMQSLTCGCAKINQ